MPGPGPIGISEFQGIHIRLAGLLARMWPIVPGPDGAARGQGGHEAAWTASAAGAAPSAQPPGGSHAVCTLQDLHGPGDPMSSGQK